MKSSLQRILVPLDPSPYAEAASRLACDVARKHNASLHGLVVLDTPEIRARIAPVEIRHWPTVIDAIRLAMEDAEEQITKARKGFAAICDENGVRHEETEMEGVPADLILEVSGLYDLVVTGLRTHYHFETREGAGNSLAKILGRTGTPLLASPAEKPAQLKRALVLYDGSRSSTRALRDFASFAQPLEMEITLLTGDADAAHGEMMLEQAAAYLRVHDLEPARLHRGGADVVKVVESDYKGVVDLIVAGIHNRSVFKDIFVGSVTKKLIEQGDVALYLSH